MPNAAASHHFPLGTDALGRDRFSRMLYGGRISLLFAPAAALLSSILALGIALLAGSSRQARRTVRRSGGGCLPVPAVAVRAARGAGPAAVECGAAWPAFWPPSACSACWVGQARRGFILAAVKRQLGFRFCPLRARQWLLRLAYRAGPDPAERAAPGRRSVPGHRARVPARRSQSRSAGTRHSGAHPVARRTVAGTGKPPRRGAPPLDVCAGAAAFHRGQHVSFVGSCR